MALNRSKGDMYPWCNFTWNPVRGRCPHECNYCFMKKYDVGELRFEEKEMKTDLGEKNTIFIGSSTDMFAGEVSTDWISKVLEHCHKYPLNTYLFQSKNPRRFHEFMNEFPSGTILGTTIETDVYSFTSKIAPEPINRALAMMRIRRFKKMVSIEPLIEFDLDRMMSMISGINPEFVSIGADSKGHKLTEPHHVKVRNLINELEKFTEVKQKSNLVRLLKPRKVL